MKLFFGFIGSMFALWGIGFWVISIIATLICAVAVTAEEDSWGGAAFTLAVYVGALTWLGDFSPLQLIKNEPTVILKWAFFYALASIPASYINMRIDGYKKNKKGQNPGYEYYKRRIPTWMMWWPFVLIGTLFNDVIHILWDWTVDFFKMLFKRISFIYRHAYESMFDVKVDE